MRKRATMMLDSDDEGDDTLAELPQPKSKRRKEDEIENLAAGPTDFINALLDAGYQPRSGSLPNLLSISFQLTIEFIHLSLFHFYQVFSKQISNTI